MALVRINDRCAYEDDHLCQNCGQQCGNAARAKELRLRDRLICGLRDSDLQQRILIEDYDSALTLTKALQICKAYESSKATEAGLSSADPLPGAAYAVRRSSYKRGSGASPALRSSTGSLTRASSEDCSRSPKSDPSNQQQPSPCSYCGERQSHPREMCKAFGKRCRRCHKIGHFASVCRQKEPVKQARVLQANDQSMVGCLHVHSASLDVKAKVDIPMTVLREDEGREYVLSWLPNAGAEIMLLQWRIWSASIHRCHRTWHPTGRW